MEFINDNISKQVLKGLIENYHLVSYFNESDFHEISENEIFKLLKKNSYTLDELILHTNNIANSELRKLTHETLLELKTIHISETNFTGFCEQFIKRQRCTNLLMEMAESVGKHKDIEYSNKLIEIETFRLQETSHTKSLLEISQSDFEEYQWHCRNFIPVIEGKLIMLTGRGASGKGISMLRNAIEYLKENRDKKVLLWNMEDSTKDIHLRINILQNNRLDIPEDVFSRLNVLDSTKEFNLEQLKQEFKNYDYVVIDPISHLIQGDENDSSKVKPIMKFFQDICSNENKIIILVHHEAKGTDGKGSKQGRGSSAFFDNSRLCYSLRYEDGSYTIETVKNNYGESRESFQLNVWNKFENPIENNVISNIKTTEYDFDFFNDSISA